MKKNEIKLIEKSEDFSLSFKLPIAQLSNDELAKLYGGVALTECSCRRGTLTCPCNTGGVLMR